MSNVSNVTISQLLQKLHRLEWQIPNFQRDFVWELRACAEFASSVLSGRPIGMVTVWYLEEGQELALEPLQLQLGQSTIRFAGTESAPVRKAAVLDGRQRSQAAAMVFGGLLSHDARSRFGQLFFLQTVSNEVDGEVDEGRPKVVFVSLKRARTRGLDSLEGAISQGYFPLDAFRPEVLSASANPTTLEHHELCRDKARDPATYGEAGRPPDAELNRRLRIFRDAMGNLGESKLAVYEVPARFNLGEICEIFETLNTSGTRVSTVDLIHSWMAGETTNRAAGSILLRSWIDELGSYPAASGWSVRKDRPELLVQMVAGTYLALAEKHTGGEKKRPAPRRIGAAPYGDTIKARDLLAIPTEHWSNLVESTGQFAAMIADMQQAVAGEGRFFGYQDCPYPSMAGIYLGLRWHHRCMFASVAHEVRDIDALFRAFFWRNAVNQRYDQGLLTKFRADLDALLAILEARRGQPRSKWIEHADRQLMGMLGEVPDEGTIIDRALDGATSGAMRSTLLLPVVAGAYDLYTDAAITGGVDSPDLHHIWPKKWCDQHDEGRLQECRREREGSDPVSSAANLMPLSRASNLEWRADHPAKAIKAAGLAWATHAARWERLGVDRDGFRLIETVRGTEEVVKFWEHRARWIARAVRSRTELRDE